MTTDKCFSCERKDGSLLCGMCGIGLNGEREYYKQKPITNADRIRAMSDEELAVFLEGAVCPTPFNGSWCKQPSGSGKRYNCKDCWLDWLKEEAEGDT